MTRPRPGVDAPLDVLEAGVVTTVRGMDEATAARILPDLERMCDTVRLLATSPDLFEIRGGRLLPDGGLAILEEEALLARMIDPATGTVPPDALEIRGYGDLRNRYDLCDTVMVDGRPTIKRIGLSIVDSVAEDGVTHDGEDPLRPRIARTVAELADVLDVAVRICVRIAEDDRVIGIADLAAIDTVVRDTVLVGEDGADGVTFASPWSDVHGTPQGTEPLDADNILEAIDPARIASMRAAMDRHWMLRHRVPLVGMGLTDELVSIGTMTRRRRDGISKRIDEIQGVERLRRHHHDAGLHARIAGWGCCPPPGDDA